MSDAIGHEAAVILAYVIFSASSLGAGLANNLNMLIAFRVLQGIGGSGLYCMIMGIWVEVTPVRYWGAVSGMVEGVLAIGSVMGISYSTLHLQSAVD